MEEKIVNAEEVVEVKEKKKISKKVLAIAAGALTLVIGAVVLAVRAGSNGDNGDQIVDTTYEPVDSSDSVVED